MLAADGADHVLVFGDESVHLVKAHGVHVHLGVLVADELVGAVAGLAGAAFQQGDLVLQTRAAILAASTDLLLKQSC